MTWAKWKVQSYQAISLTRVTKEESLSNAVLHNTCALVSWFYPQYPTPLSLLKSSESLLDSTIHLITTERAHHSSIRVA